MKTKLTKNQKRIFGPKIYSEDGITYRIKATVRHDDNCGNGHNTFTITADIEEKKRNNRWYWYGGGCCHDEVAKYFPELAPLLKWHLSSTDGPMHYIANTVYLAGDRDYEGLLQGKERDLDAARDAAMWPEATDEELCLPPKELKEKLIARLPRLLEEFQAAVESLGMVW